jgi:hypothetical protein
VQVTLRGPREEAAADLDVTDLPALVESWARNVARDWSA